MPQTHILISFISRTAKHDELIRLLLNHGATLSGTENFQGRGGSFEPPIQNRSSVNVLVAAARRKRWAFMRAVLRHCGADAFGASLALQVLVDSLQNDAPKDIVELLLPRVESIAVVDARTGRTALTSAGGSSRDVVEIVVARAKRDGVGIDATDRVGHSVLMRALIEATEHCEAVVELLVSEGADPLLRTPEGMDALMLASSVTTPTRLEDEAQFRSLYSPRDRSKKTACISAAKQAHTAQVLDVLCRAGASITVRDGSGKSGFHYACESGLEDVVYWYVNKMAAEDELQLLTLPVAETKETPVMLLAKTRDCEGVLEEMVGRGANLLELLPDGSSVLSLAAKERSNMIGKLLELGADPSIGVHPLTVAASPRPIDFETLSMLVESTPVTREVAQNVIALLQAEGRYYDPYGDFQLAARCAHAAGIEMQARAEYEQREKLKLVEKLREMSRH